MPEIVALQSDLRLCRGIVPWQLFRLLCATMLSQVRKLEALGAWGHVGLSDKVLHM